MRVLGKGYVARIQRRNWNKYPSNWKAIADESKKQNGYVCAKCGTSGSYSNPIETDHIIQLGKGGKNTQSNLRSLCRLCNRARRRGK